MLYPGSIERTSTAERNEPKGFVTLEIEPGGDGGRLTGWRFHQLPTRPMLDLTIDAGGLARAELAERIAATLGRADPDAVVRLTVRGDVAPEAAEVLRAASLRALAPATQTLDLRRPGYARRR